MHWREQACGDGIREHILSPITRYVFIKPTDIGQATAEHDHIGIKYIDHTGQGAIRRS